MTHMPRRLTPPQIELETAIHDFYGLTPLAMMLRGYQVAATHFAINDKVACHLTDAASEQAQAILDLSHKTAALWLEPEPISPITAVTKIAQTRTLLMTHVQDITSQNLRRFEEFHQDGVSLMRGAL